MSPDKPVRRSASERCADTEIITLYEISKILTSSLDFAKSIRGVLNVLQSYLHMDCGLVSLVHKGGELHVIGASDASTASHVGAVSEKILRGGAPIVVPDKAQDPLFAPGAEAGEARNMAVAFVGVPIREGRDAIGVLSVERRPGSDRPINFERDLRILTLVANLVGQTHKLQQSVAAERQILLEEKHRLQKRLQGQHDIENVVARSRRMKEVFADVHQAAAGNAGVLLRGESGTGKEAIANAVHFLSSRAKGPFVKVNCAALPETLLESELFGHEKGAFTGATTERHGRFEVADGGTLFLDEIGDISPSFQAKLLRVLQEHEFERVGGNKTLRANFRLVAATNRNLEEMVTKGSFRADLYFRINVVSILLPPLRERKEDIPLLVDFFLDRHNRENLRKLAITPAALEVFMRCNWPGNVRELENCVERTATMCRGSHISESDMLCERGQCFSSVLLGATPRPVFPVVAPSAAPDAPAPDMPAASPPEDDERVLSERERLIDAMEKCGWVQAKAARMLHLTSRQMGYALKKYNIQVKRF